MLAFRFPRPLLVVLFAFLTLQSAGCTVIRVVDTVASTAVGVTKVAIKGTTAVVSAAIPGGGDDDEDEED